MQTVRNYLSLVKFSHTIFAMPFALIGFFLGFERTVTETSGHNSLRDALAQGYVPDRDLFLKFLLVILCMVFARSAAMAFNRWLDKNFDALNPRTAIREIPAGIVSANSALVFTIVNCLLFILCAYLINFICFALSPVALFVILGYSYTKRFTPLCHLILGIGLSLAPIGAYLAVTGAFAMLPILFSLTVVFWVSGFDIIYSLQDEEFDRNNRLYSIPAALGKSRALRVSELLHLLSVVTLSVAGSIGAFSLIYWIGVAFFTAMLIYQHSVVKPSDLSRVNLAFMTANGIASVVFAGFVLTDLFIQ
jgi:4-hydroxybenzoate polyprenyltransferase